MQRLAYSRSLQDACSLVPVEKVPRACIGTSQGRSQEPVGDGMSNSGLTWDRGCYPASALSPSPSHSPSHTLSHRQHAGWSPWVWARLRRGHQVHLGTDPAVSRRRVSPPWSSAAIIRPRRGDGAPREFSFRGIRSAIPHVRPAVIPSAQLPALLSSGGWLVATLQMHVIL
jgi:hypothetical protein